MGKRLADNLAKEGSDKSTAHDYHGIYADFITELGADRELNILEIGIGTNNRFIISSMDENHIPGPSLRAYRDTLPNAKIYGADVDKDILFTEDRLKTAWVDQMDQSTFAKMTDDLRPSTLRKNRRSAAYLKSKRVFTVRGAESLQSVETKFDFIIDDGLHAITANLHVLLYALEHLREGGIFIAEDIPGRHLPTWTPVINMLRDNYHCGLISCKGGYMFFLQIQKDNG